MAFFGSFGPGGSVTFGAIRDQPRLVFRGGSGEGTLMVELYRDEPTRQEMVRVTLYAKRGPAAVTFTTLYDGPLRGSEAIQVLQALASGGM